jgi:hypothetical protein
MPDPNHVISFTAEVNTAEGQRQLEEMVRRASETGPTGVSRQPRIDDPGLDQRAQEFQREQEAEAERKKPEERREQEKEVEALLRRIGMPLDALRNAFKSIGSTVSGFVASAAGGLPFGAMAGMAESLGGGLSVAAGSLGAGGAVGLGAISVAVGGVTAALGGMVAAVGVVTAGLKTLGDRLATYSVGLFAAVTEFRLFMMGASMLLSRSIAPVLSQFYQALQRLITSSLPGIINIIDAVTPVVTELLHLMADMLGLSGQNRSALQVLSTLLRELIILLRLLVLPIRIIMALFESIVSVVVEVIDTLTSVLGLGAPLGDSIKNTTSLLDALSTGLNNMDFVVRYVTASMQYAFISAADIIMQAAGKIAKIMSLGLTPDFDVFSGAVKSAKLKMDGAFAEMEKAFREGGRGAANEVIAAGMRLSRALFDAATMWAGTREGHGPQVDYSPSREGMPPVPGIIPTTRSPIETHVDRSRGGEEARSMPQPTSAAINFRVADSVQIQAQDEDRLHMELLMWKNQVFQMLHSLQDGRWSRMALARVI